MSGVDLRSKGDCLKHRQPRRSSQDLPHVVPAAEEGGDPRVRWRGTRAPLR
jgi:hypothetical protein